MGATGSPGGNPTEYLFMPPDKDEKEKARGDALRFLKFSLRSEQEIREKLSQKEYSKGVIEETLASLKRSGLVDDEVFARLWVESRIKRPLGRNRLRRELKEKGVDAGWIDAALERVSEDYDEKKVIRDLVRQKVKRMRDPEADKVKARLFGYLVRRGFPKNLVIETILEEFR